MIVRILVYMSVIVIITYSNDSSLALHYYY